MFVRLYSCVDSDFGRFTVTILGGAAYYVDGMLPFSQP